MAGGIQVNDGDLLNFGSRASSAQPLRLVVNILSSGGKLEQRIVQHTSSSDRSATSTTSTPLRQGTLVSATVDGQQGAVQSQPGIVWVEAYLFDPNNTNKVQFIGGYLWVGNIPSYPGRLMSSREGPGLVKIVATADPAAGAEIAAQAVPTNAEWRLQSFRIQLVQGITQTPRARLNLRNGSGTSLALLESQAALAASTTVDYTWALDGPSINGATAGALVQNMPLPRLTLLQAYDVITSTSGIGANSNYGVGQLQVEEWIVE